MACHAGGRGVTRVKIFQLLTKGYSARSIAKMLSIRPPTVTFHKRKIQEETGAVLVADRSPRLEDQDGLAARVQDDLDKLLTYRQIAEKHGISTSSITAALNRGALKKPKTKQMHMNSEELGRHWSGRVATIAFRKSMKKRLRREGRPQKCEECGITHWRGHPVILELHHKTDDSTKNMPQDLALVCLNCHSLTASYRGRNTRASKKKRHAPCGA